MTFNGDCGVVSSLVRAVCDAGPLIHLDEMGCLDILADLHRVALPCSVREEVLRHRPAPLDRTPFVVVPDPEPDLAVLSVSRGLCLHTGERAALSLFKIEQSDIFLTDDTAARLAAVQLGFTVHGTLGLLLRSFRTRRRTREEVETLVRDLPVRSTLFIKDHLIQRAIAELHALQA